MTVAAALPLLSRAEQFRLDRDFPCDPGHFRLFFDWETGRAEAVELQDFDYWLFDGVVFVDDVRYATADDADDALDLLEFLDFEAERQVLRDHS